MLDFSHPVNRSLPRSGPHRPAPSSQKILTLRPCHLPYGVMPRLRLRKSLATVEELLFGHATIPQSEELIYLVFDSFGVAWVGRSKNVARRIRAHWDKRTSLGAALRRDPAALRWGVTVASPKALASFAAENLRALIPSDYPSAHDVLDALNDASSWSSAVNIEFLCIAITNPYLNRLGRRFKWTVDRDSASRALLDEFLRRARR